MSTIKATNITDLTGTYTSTTTAINRGIAKAWVNFDGTTASPSTIRASYNVSSVTKNGTGDYTINFTTALADANYSANGFGSAGGSNYQIFGGNQGNGYVATASSLRCQFGYVSGTSGSLTNQDPPIACIQIFR